MIFDDHPILRSLYRHLLTLVGFLLIAEIDAVPHVLRPGNDLNDRCCRPVIRPIHICGIPSDADALFRHIYRRAVNVVRNTFSAVTLADLIQELYGMIRSKQEAR